MTKAEANFEFKGNLDFPFRRKYFVLPFPPETLPALLEVPLVDSPESASWAMQTLDYTLVHSGSFSESLG